MSDRLMDKYPKGVVTDAIASPILDQNTVHRPFEPSDPERVLVGIEVISSKPAKSDLQKVGRRHGRNRSETATHNSLVWGGMLPGDIYGSRDFKGNVFDDIRIITMPSSPYNWALLGLKDDVGLHRIDVVSQYLRAHGLPTEFPRVKRQVTELLIKDYSQGPQKILRVPLATWEQQQLNNIWKEAQLKRKVDLTGALTLERQWQEIKDYFASTNFYIVERDLQTAERVEDLNTPINETEMRQSLEPIFKWLNAATAARKSGIISNTPQPQPFIFRPDHVKQYCGEWLPRQMGIYLGRLHNLGIEHKYPHAQNWSAVGTLYDLDSPVGLPFGDKPITNSDKRNDVGQTNNSLRETLSFPGSYLSETYPDLKSNALAMFVASYIKETLGETATQARIEELSRTIFLRGIKVSDYINNPKIIQGIGLDNKIWERVDAILSAN